VPISRLLGCDGGNVAGGIPVRSPACHGGALLPQQGLDIDLSCFYLLGPTTSTRYGTAI
jgi:hypothetical protein